ncbi:MAG TPA: LLM class flavin-dependent oxidoreductase [Candidatus Limnocylindrales bacterium]|nr:LLM class flavin-dependent oxidoreductase [Candidatus Limnocylindrales bacterium]
MRFGFIPSEGGTRFQDAIDEAVLAERLGFDSVWLEEHHGVRDHYWPSPIVVLAAIAARTERLVLGTDVIVLPFYLPVRLAEDVAVVQGISNGRFVLGLAIGYRPEEFALHDAALDGRGARLEEAVALIRALWAGESVDHAGPAFRVVGRIEPLPEPAPPIWLGGWGPKTIQRAATIADAWVPGPTADLQRLLRLRGEYDAALVAAGRDPASVRRPLTREVVIAETDEAAWALAERHLLVNYRDEYGGGWSHPLVGKADATPTDRLDQLADGRFIVGSPETCVAAIRRLSEGYGPDELICRLFFAGLPHEVLESELRLLAEHVLPAFR